ncbi:uncharacterized protein [Amphiura filiformis]|uniref:uncharacterized protein n=1 Tax=Amphiura filiformis TaxID=82378 RepID=UPI003B22319A
MTIEPTFKAESTHEVSSHETSTIIQSTENSTIEPTIEAGNSSTITLTTIIVIAVGAGVAVLVIIAITVALVTYCKRNKNPANGIVAYSTYIPPPLPPPNIPIDDQNDDTEVEMAYATTGADRDIPNYQGRRKKEPKQDMTEDSSKSEEQQYHNIGVSSYSTYLPDTEEDSDNPVEEEYDDTGIEIPHDNMEYEIPIGTDKDKPNSLPGGEDSNNSEKQHYHDIGISSYSTYLPDTEEDSDNPVEEDNNDTEIEIPHDNMEYETVGADKDKPYYLEVY